ncbi:hypothetical protein QTN94_14315 [Vibrio sp. M250220]|uniref:hypothetical protein n=1 Tax=Vibrio sp. M250220 TaxID=3020894 RepID=UPI002F3F498C
MAIRYTEEQVKAIVTQHAKEIGAEIISFEPDLYYLKGGVERCRKASSRVSYRQGGYPEIRECSVLTFLAKQTKNFKNAEKSKKKKRKRELSEKEQLLLSEYRVALTTGEVVQLDRAELKKWEEMVTSNDPIMRSIQEGLFLAWKSELRSLRYHRPASEETLKTIEEFYTRQGKQ